MLFAIHNVVFLRTKILYYEWQLLELKIYFNFIYISDTNDRNAKQKTLLPAEYNETPSSAHFMGYFLTAIVLCIAGYIVFHNKQKVVFSCHMIVL